MKNQNNTPLVSIIVNCHNGEEYLNECISSIINQTYKNWELIFWDNMSNDSSYKILKNYSDNRIKYFKSKTFTSLYVARNLALEKASGDFISFLDTDDWWVNDKVQKQIKLFSNNKNLNVVYTNFYVFKQKRKKKKIISNKNLPTGKITQQLLNVYNMGGILTALVRKEVFEKTKFDSDYEIIADFDFFVKTSLNNVFDCIQEPLAFYRIHESNTIIKKIGLQIYETEKWLQKNSKINNLKDYSFNGVISTIQLLKIKRNLLEGKKIKAFKEIFKSPFYIKKYKFLFGIFLPVKILNIFVN